MDGLLEPNDGEADDGDAFDERRDRVGHRRSGGEDCECQEVLRKVDSAVDNEVDNDGRASTRYAVMEESPRVRVDPYRNHEDECHAAGKVEEIDLVEFVRCRRFGRHDPFKEDGLRDEDQCRTEGAY